MSVINQMLKDLDQRQVEQQGSSNFTAPGASPTSNKKIIFICLVVIILLNAGGLFVWQMYVENQNLKTSMTTEIEQIDSPALQNKTPANGELKQEPQISKFTMVADVNNQPSQRDNINGAVVEHLTPDGLGPNELTLNELTTNELGPGELTIANSSSGKLANDELKLTANQNSAAIGNANKNTASTMGVPLSSNDSMKNSSNILQAPNSTEVKKSTLKISRKQLTPRELAKQKLKRAEQALDVNDVSKAESLFEDVLLVMPEHKSARKQLAALWFGRQSYTDALNLLSQGIDLSPNDSELRVMKARIYLQQNRIQQAFATLNDMPRADDVFNVEFQSLRATTAQQLNEYSFAAQAYQILVNIEPAAGRWWLGLAVALDSDSKFKQASIAYQTALNQTGLSGSAEKFARQRITELGE